MTSLDEARVRILCAVLLLSLTVTACGSPGPAPPTSTVAAKSPRVLLSEATMTLRDLLNKGCPGGAPLGASCAKHALDVCGAVIDVRNRMGDMPRPEIYQGAYRIMNRMPPPVDLETSLSTQQGILAVAIEVDHWIKDNPMH